MELERKISDIEFIGLEKDIEISRLNKEIVKLSETISYLNSKCNVCQANLLQQVEMNSRAEATPIRIAQEISNCVKHEITIANTLNFPLLKFYTHNKFLERVLSLCYYAFY